MVWYRSIEGAVQCRVEFVFPKLSLPNCNLVQELRVEDQVTIHAAIMQVFFIHFLRWNMGQVGALGVDAATGCGHLLAALVRSDLGQETAPLAQVRKSTWAW